MLDEDEKGVMEKLYQANANLAINVSDRDDRIVELEADITCLEMNITRLEQEGTDFTDNQAQITKEIEDLTRAQTAHDQQIKILERQRDDAKESTRDEKRKIGNLDGQIVSLKALNSKLQDDLDQRNIEIKEHDDQQTEKRKEVQRLQDELYQSRQTIITLKSEKQL